MSRASVDSLLDAVKQLPPGELDEFNDRFARWQQEEADDDLLLRVIQRGLSLTDDARLKTLIAKSEEGILAQDERAEYQALARRAEQLNAQRVQALAELARRRGKPIREMMQEVGWQGDVHGA